MLKHWAETFDQDTLVYTCGTWWCHVDISGTDSGFRARCAYDSRKTHMLQNTLAGGLG